MMKKYLRVGTLLASLAVSVSAFAQTSGNQPAEVGSCREVAGEATIDGSIQQTVGRACLQADGTWQFAQNPDGSVITYQASAYPYDDAWYYGPPLLFAGSFIFIDGFHRHHSFNRFRQVDHGHFSHGHFNHNHFDGRAGEGFHG